jgi:putative PIN family toxin of toxin-antitoxin system
LRVFLDTNVLVSAFTTRGICSDIMTLVLAEHQLALGETVLAEMSRILDRKMRMPTVSVEEAEALLRREAVVVSHGADISLSVRDPDDVAVLGEAIEGWVDVLVTGDRDLLEISDECPIEILSPRGFWEKLQGHA